MIKLFIFLLIIVLLLSLDNNNHVEALNGGSWMTDLYSNNTKYQALRLFDLTIPGTHDSGAYYLSSDIAPDATGNPTMDMILELAEKLGIRVDDIVRPWGLAQSLTIYDQLMAGARYIDLRACFLNTTNQWHTMHFNVGVTIETILSDISRFLSTAPSHEILFIETSHEIGDGTMGTPTMNDFNELTSMMNKYLGKYLIDRNTNIEQITIQQLTANGPRVLLSLDHDDAIVTIPSIFYGSIFTNSYADKCDLPSMITYNNQQAKQFSSNPPTNSFFKLSWTLTPSGTCIIDSYLPGSTIHSLKDLAIVGNGGAPSFASSHLELNERIGHMILFDQVQASDALDIAVDFIMTKL